MDTEIGNVSSTLLLGTAGGALATLLSRRGVEVTAVDNWQIAFDIAQRWFHLPEAVECINLDALEFLRSTPGRWDAIAVDVFRGTNIPASVLRIDIGALLSKALTPGGIIVWNVADDATSWTTRWIAATLSLSGFKPRYVSVLEFDIGNTLVVCRDPRGPPIGGNGAVPAERHTAPPSQPSNIFSLARAALKR